MTDTMPVRAGEELNLARLVPFLHQHIAELPDLTVAVTQFPTGASNLTYALQCGDVELVLRRPPLGPVAPKAHDMAREFRVLQALHPHFPLAPEAFVYSDDASIIGSPFFVMERRRGVVLNTDFPDGIAAAPDIGRKLSGIMVKELVELHQIDYRQTALAEMTKPAGFMLRQVEGWIGRYERAKTEEVKGIDVLMRWLRNQVPVVSGHTVIHYDFKFNNAMFDPTLQNMVGLFDWEMATVGDPLADVGAAMSYWIQADDPDLLKYGMGQPPITVIDGFMTRRDFIEAYAKASGRDVSHIHFYLTFAYFKLAVIVQQIYYRYQAGQTMDKRFAQMNHAVAALVEYASAMTGEAGMRSI